ncbi:MAG TPA: OsmC family protein [Agitococcus sp.]|nr:OsmC family protein [Agitococcus sp.]
MKAAIQWVKDVSFVAESGSGHALVLDGAPEYGGRNIGPRPMELLLMGLGGCASFDVVTILKKARQQVTDVRAELSAERADAVPAVFTKIHLHFIVTGNELKETQVKKAVELSAEKYCSASAMLSAGGVVITHDYEIVAE